MRLSSEGVQDSIDDLNRYEAGNFAHLVQTGIQSLDEKLDGGLCSGAMHLLGAPSGGGKTTILQQIGSHAAKKGPVLLVTPEMSLRALAEREIIRTSGVRKWDRNPWCPIAAARDSARRAHLAAGNTLTDESMPLYVLDKNGATMLDVEEAAMKLRPHLLLIDYAQQVAELNDDRPRYLQVADVATRSVALALELDIPVVVASQVNTVREGNAKSYTFRETAILEHKAHTVLVFVAERREDLSIKSAFFACSKNRSGPMFKCDVDYDPATYTVRDKSVEATGPEGWNR